jgi:hypothetical protein
VSENVEPVGRFHGAATEGDRHRRPSLLASASSSAAR